MENFRINFGELHIDLSAFVSQLSTRYKPASPSALQHVQIIPTILPVDDYDFVREDVNSIITKVTVVMDVTWKVLNKVGPFVQKEHTDWLKEQTAKLTWWLDVVEQSAFHLRLIRSSSGGSALAGGIGGINTGVQGGMNYESLSKLQNLLKVFGSMSL